MERTTQNKSHAQLLVEAREGRDLPEVLRELFVLHRMTHTAIADRLGVSRGTVARWIDEYDVDPRKAAIA